MATPATRLKKRTTVKRCGRCRKRFGVFAGARSVKCPHCAKRRKNGPLARKAFSIGGGVVMTRSHRGARRKARRAGYSGKVRQLPVLNPATVEMIRPGSGRFKLYQLVYADGSRGRTFQTKHAA